MGKIRRNKEEKKEEMKNKRKEGRKKRSVVREKIGLLELSNGCMGDVKFTIRGENKRKKINAVYKI